MRFRRRSEDNLVFDRQGVYYYGQSALNDFWLGRRWRSYVRTEQGAHMLLEDVHNALLPIGSSYDDKWSVELLSRAGRPSIADAEDFVIQALDREDHSYDVRDALQRFLPDCASNIMLEGRSLYEIVLRRDAETKSVKAVELIHLPLPSVGHDWQGWFQRVPKDVAAEAQRPCKMRLSQNRVFCFVWPKELGTDAYRRATLEAEVICRQRLMPAFYFPKAEVRPFLGVHFPRKKLPFDHEYHRETNFVAVGKVGKRWGYGHRSLMSDQMGDYYNFWRILHWERFVMRLRDLLLVQLNQALLQMEEWAGPLGYLEVKGLPTVKDCDQLIHELESGPESYGSLTKSLRL